MDFAHFVYLWNVYLFIFRLHYLFIYVFLLFPEVQECYVSGTVSDYLFIYVFLLFPEVQECYVFRHCVRLFVYICISIISRSPGMLCFQALCQIICLFMYFYYFQKSRNVMFSGTVSDYLFIYVFLLFPEVQECYVYLFIYVFLLFPEVQECYVFRHCVRLFVYLCISIISRSPEMLCFQALCQIICLFMYFYYFQKSRNVMFSGTVSDYLFIYVFLLFPEVQECYVSGTVSDYLFIYVFLLFPEVQECYVSGTVSDYLFIYVFLLFPEVQKFYVFRHCVRLFVYICISIISRSPEMLCFQALCQIICLFMYFYYFQKSRNVMFSGTVSDYLFIYVFLLFPEVQKCYVSGTVSDYLFIYVFLLFPEVQKCYVFRHCVRLFVYICISIISRSPEMLCFQALCQIICLFMYFYYFQKSRNVMFSGTVSDYLFIYEFLLFPEVQECYVFRHCVRLFVYICISIISRSPGMLCFQALCQIICLYMYFYYFQKSRNVMFQALCQIICLYMYFYYFQKSRNVMFSGTVSDYLFIYVFLLFPEVQKCYVSGTVSDYLFIYVFLLFPEVQKCYVFRHCVRLFVYICISIISRSPGMLCFRHCVRLFVYICISIISRSPGMLCFWHCVRLFVYICISIISRSPEMLCFRHCVRLFVYICISIISRSPEMLCFQALCQIICLYMYFYYFQKSRNVMFQALCQIICLYMYFYYFQKSRNVMFSGTVSDYLFIYVFLLFPEVQECYVSGTVSDYLFIYVFLLFPEVQECYVFRHCALCKTGSSQWSVFETDITMSWISTNTVNKHFFASSVTHSSTSRYMVDQIVWQWIE